MRLIFNARSQANRPKLDGRHIGALPGITSTIARQPRGRFRRPRSCGPKSLHRRAAIVFDGWKRLIEMMQQRPPLLIARRLAKPLRMIFQLLPARQKEIAPLGFNARPHFEIDEARRRRNKRQSNVHGFFEGQPLPSLHVEHRMLEDQIDCPDFFQSARNCSSPLSVRGCLTSDLMTAGGQVATSAPISATCLTCSAERIEAASTSVSKP